ncbi:hypothetical protein SAMN05216289_12144 [Dokdonella immobilis]|uniref:Uncharacterized protein n=1 Tax=Dokdonella immobilis TaxID=578942 RepID=A0A1I4YZP8_9GAMM|nr:hypothetical protein SAMN05216289_12144 [Dokdonella immobilis]
MNQDTQGKLEISGKVVEQLNAMARNSATPGGYSQAPRTPGPTPSPNISREGQQD